MLDVENLKRASTSSNDSNYVPKPHGYGLSGDLSWITYDGTKILWFPPEHRAARLHALTLSTATVIIGCVSGIVEFYESFAEYHGGWHTWYEVETLGPPRWRAQVLHIDSKKWWIFVILVSWSHIFISFMHTIHCCTYWQALDLAFQCQDCSTLGLTLHPLIRQSRPILGLRVGSTDLKISLLNMQKGAEFAVRQTNGNSC
jgi:hypothetical protein